MYAKPPNPPTVTAGELVAVETYSAELLVAVILVRVTKLFM